MVPVLPAPVPHHLVHLRRKRKAENQGVQGADKRTTSIALPPPHPPIEAYFSRACSLQTTVIAGVHPDHDIHTVDSFHGHTDDEECSEYSSDAGGGGCGSCAVVGYAQPRRWKGVHGAVGPHQQHQQHHTTGEVDLTNHVMIPDGGGPDALHFRNVQQSGMPMRAGGAGIQREDVGRGGGELDEWGWFVDAGVEEEALRPSAPSRLPFVPGGTVQE